VLLLIAALITGCRGPSPDDRENRRALDAILTAITLKNRRLLDESFERAKLRRDAGQFGGGDFESIEAFVAEARIGKWAEAERDAYVFRRAHPYVMPGQ
jgi:hypothetical protein